MICAFFFFLEEQVIFRGRPDVGVGVGWVGVKAPFIIGHLSASSCPGAT